MLARMPCFGFLSRSCSGNFAKLTFFHRAPVMAAHVMTASVMAASVI